MSRLTRITGEKPSPEITDYETLVEFLDANYPTVEEKEALSLDQFAMNNCFFSEKRWHQLKNLNTHDKFDSILYNKIVDVWFAIKELMALQKRHESQLDLFGDKK